MNLNEMAVRNLSIRKNYGWSGMKNDFLNMPRPFSSVGYFWSGEMKFYQDGRTITVRSGDMIFVPFGARYHSTIIDEAFYTSVYFTVDFFNTHRRQFRITKLSGYGFDADFEHFRDNRNREPSFDTLARLYKLIAHLAANLEYTDAKLTDPRIAPALDLLDAHPELPCKIGELASLCHLSESHFYAIFAKQTGITPIEYKKRAAITLAEQLLYDRTLSIEDVSSAAGFSSAAYFRRVFRDQTGLSPREYRKREEI